MKAHLHVYLTNSMFEKDIVYCSQASLQRTIKKMLKQMKTGKIPVNKEPDNKFVSLYWIEDTK